MPKNKALSAVYNDEAQEEREQAPHLEHFPAGQISGDTWVIGVLDDLIAYSEHRGMVDLTASLRSAHRVAAKSCLH